jgi:hypothetical protein
MNSYSFNTYVSVIAENYEEAINTFDFQTKDLNVYVAEITTIEEDI